MLNRCRRSLLAGLWVSLVASFTSASLLFAAPPPTVDVLIAYKSPPGRADHDLITKQGGRIKYSYWIVNAVAASVPETALDGISRNPKVSVIEPDAEVQAVDAEMDAAWGVQKIGGEIAHAGGFTGAGVRVGVIDTGIDYRHSDLDANYRGGWDFVNNDSDPLDDNGHGTHVAGTIAAEDNGAGVVGVAPNAELYALKVLGANGSGSFSSILAAIQWCVNNGIDVTNNSYGTSSNPGSTVRQAYDNAAALGVVMIASAGNTGNSSGTGENVGYPGAFDSVMAVAATTSGDSRASYSSTGPQVEIAAPGSSVYSTTYGGGYGYKSGTSMACPHVVGAAAVLIGAGLTDGADVRFVLDMSSVDLGASGLDTWYGYGRVNVAAALSALETMPPPPPAPVPDPDPAPEPTPDPVTPPPGVASVDWIAYSTYGGRNSDKHLSVGVGIVNENGTAIANATVQVQIARNGAVVYSGQSSTGSSGAVSFTLNNVRSGTYTTRVTSVVADGYEWDGATPANSFDR